MKPLFCPLFSVLLIAGNLTAQAPPSASQTPSNSPQPAAPAKPVTITAEHYRVYNSLGWPSSLDEILSMADTTRVVILGESHDDPVAHFLEAEIFKRLHAKYKDLALSLEMFETDTQGVLNEYLAGLIPEDQLISAGRAWRNYRTDYKPMVDYAKEHKLPVIAANAPRRYVNRVGRLGAESLNELPAEAKALLPPLPYQPASKAYRARFEKVMEEGRKQAEEEARKRAEEQSKQTAADPHAAQKKAASAPPQPMQQHPSQADLERTLAAQSLWDASMSFSIADFLTRRPSTRVMHVNGRFHSEARLGLVEHLARYRPDVRPLIVGMMPSKSFPNFDAAQMKGMADFIIVTDESLPRSMSPGPGFR
jgi:uncharacterized iron-regulated protein